MRRFGEGNDPAAAASKARLSSYERRVSEERRLKFNTNVGLATAVFIGLLVCWAHGGTKTTSIAAFGASLGLGGVLGFLFGVPSAAKSPVNIGKIGSVAVDTGSGSTARAGNFTMPPAGGTAPHPTPPTAAPPPHPPMTSPGADPLDTGIATEAHAPTASATVSPGQTLGLSSSAEALESRVPSSAGPPPDPPPPPVPAPAPSNLEQVADWVTKLLLGGGLTQMQRIPPKIWQWSHAVAMGILGNTPGTPQLILAEQAFACGLLVYGFVLGFFGGFLITKLQLGKAIAE